MSASPIVMLIVMACALIVMANTVHAISANNFRSFSGHPLRFLCFAVYWAAIGGGAVATLLGLSGAFPMEWGSAALLFGLALRFLSDRRRAR